MRVPTKLAAFAFVLAVAFGIGTAIGSAAGPIDVTDDAPTHDDGSDH